MPCDKVPRSLVTRVIGGQTLGAEGAEAADRPSPLEFVFGVDLDGVCTDFYGAMRHLAAEWMGLPVDELTER
jgi:hypothetical protein